MLIRCSHSCVPNLLCDANIETNNIESNKLQLLREMISTRRNEIQVDSSEKITRQTFECSRSHAYKQNNDVDTNSCTHTQIDYYAKLSNVSNVGMRNKRLFDKLEFGICAILKIIFFLLCCNL